MGERGHKRRRVFIEDVRGGGSYLRATWHPERRLFTISTWNGEVCTGAVRLPAHRAPELVSLVVDGLAEPVVAPPADASAGAGGFAGGASRPPRPAGPAGWPSWLPPVRRPAGPPRRSPLDGVRRWWADRGAVVAPPVPLRPPPPAPAGAPEPAVAGQAPPPPVPAGPPPGPAAPAPPGDASTRWADVTPVPLTPPAEGEQTG